MTYLAPKYNTEMPEKLLLSAAKGETIAQYCASIGIHEGTYYYWAKEHAAFNDAAQKARVLRHAHVDMIVNNAITDTDDDTPKYNHKTLHFWAQARNRAVYGRQAIEVEQRVTSTTTDAVDYSALSNDQLLELLDEKL